MPDRSVITIGNFDGVHLGHRSIISHALRRAREASVPLKVMTFDPHPASILRPGHEPLRLTSRDEKCDTLRHLGAAEVVLLEPTRQLLSLEPHDFIARLVADHRPIAFVEGIDFRFGKGRAGDLDTLAALGKEFDFESILVPDEQVALSDHLLAPVSSSLVRWLLSHGRVADAAICLGRHFSLRGKVVTGDQRGRTLGVPTANLDPAAIAGRAIPADGVYAGLVDLPDGQIKAAAISVGIKPTFNKRTRTIEAHLLDYTGDLYDQPVTLRFGRWLREQQPFPSLDALKAQLGRDIASVRQLHGHDSLAPLIRAPGPHASV